MRKGRLRGRQEVVQDRDRAASLGRERRKERSPNAPRAISGSSSLCLETSSAPRTPHSGCRVSGETNEV